MAREREKMTVVVWWWWWLVALLFAMAIVSCSARNTITSLSGSDMVLGGRSLKAMIDDYGDPSANRGHDPKTGAGSNGNPRSGDNP